mmetsp:Transcript_43027/g.104050  ORF Transcript_43027/g.104050 Transcript_43027/m.104050 type:complete len:929 (+) Transcript_43027:106-2892(+)
MMDDQDMMDGGSNSNKRSPQILLDGDDDEDGKDEVGPMMLQSTMTSSSIVMTSPSHKQRRSVARRRRRSSARFLHHLGGSNNALLNLDRDGDDDDNEGGNLGGTGGMIDGEADDILNSTQNINSVYKQAIRMNAENKINASNSWNLSLIDHLDRVTMSSKGGSSASSSAAGFSSRTMDDSLVVDGVNFTKASCTLDASVKIYSYRVDDVHLTSYKVLANLNRTDHKQSNKANDRNNNSSNNNGQDVNGDGGEEDDHESSRGSNGRSKNSATCTLERNLANINLHKLDAAFDIDPLFHQVSKKFDEGGAKGLLLANLGVDINGGARIIFDSTLDENKSSDSSTSSATAEEGDPPEEAQQTNIVTVSSLQSKLQSQLESSGKSSLQELELVPQLASLRLDYFNLNQEGFVDETHKSSKRYASSHHDEAEADKSIHIEAIERSRVSQGDLGGRSFLSSGQRSDGDGEGRASAGSFPSGGFEPDDFGVPDFDLGGDDDDAGGLFHDGDHRFSSASFQAVGTDGLQNNEDPNSERTNGGAPRQSSAPLSQATVLLDAIASGRLSASGGIGPVGTAGGYEYYDNKELERLVESTQFSQGVNNNLWAGADHWKKGKSTTGKSKQDASQEGSSQRPGASTGKRKKTKKASSNAETSTVLVDITNPIDGLDQLLGSSLASSKRTKYGAGKSKTKSCGWTDAAVTKHAKVTNLLPHDAGLSVGELSKLFLRPKATLANIIASKQSVPAPKTVGFMDSNFDGDLFGYDDNDGVGFDFAGGGDDDLSSHSNEFVIADLDDVRKVNKINVGYATVAKKVDVKRLKRDLWVELEQALSSRKRRNAILDDDSATSSVENKIFVDQKNDENFPEEKEEATPLSFQSVVSDMQQSQAQGDVTLPFYFICTLHLCNEKGLALESCGLDDFRIHGSADAMAGILSRQ